MTEAAYHECIVKCQNSVNHNYDQFYVQGAYKLLEDFAKPCFHKY